MNPSLIRVDVFAENINGQKNINGQIVKGSVYIPVMWDEIDVSRLSFFVSGARVYTDPAPDLSKPNKDSNKDSSEPTKKHRGGRRKGQPTWVESITAALGKKSLGTAAILANMEAAGVEINVDNPKRYIGHLLSVHSKGRGAPFARVRGERGVYRVR